MKSYRVVVGSEYHAGRDIFLATAFHMTFYATDMDVLKYLMVVANCPPGRTYEACKVLMAVEERRLYRFIDYSSN